uniref:Uncharacterized protein n=1 Tax=Strongyloides papillosus TaxID=174720 RepID=A0A0N5CIQ2_STREA
MVQTFATNMVQFEERKSLHQFSSIYKEKLEEFKNCTKNAKHIAISLQNYVPVYESVDEISDQVEKLLMMNVKKLILIKVV